MKGVVKMRYTYDVREYLTAEAMKRCKLDSHIKNMEFKKDAQTWAERIAVRFYDKNCFPVKNSYMYCDTLDMCFFYDRNMVPTITYAGYVQNQGKDTLALPSAFDKAKKVLEMMEAVRRQYDIARYVVGNALDR